MAMGARSSAWRRPSRAGGKGPRGPSALLLAAGASSRFPGTKQIARIGGKTLVERALDAIPPAEVRETVVVLGHEAASVSNVLRGREGVRVVVNPGYRSGMGGSISAGILALAKDTEGAMLLLADQPFVTRSLLLRMLRTFEQRGARGMVAAVQGDVVSPPAIFTKEYFDELAGLRGDQGARSVIQRHAGELLRVRVRSRRALSDIDTWGDFKTARRLLEP